MSRAKKLLREIKLLNLTEKFSFDLRLGNLIQHDSEVKMVRKKIFGLPIGKKIKTTYGSTDIKIYKSVKFLSDNFDVIITGSCALKIFGLLDRNIDCDIDIIADQETIDELSDKYNEYTYDTRYGDNPDLNYIKTFVIDGMKVDVFLNEGQKFQIIDNVKVNEPFELIDVKLSLNRTKDYQDVEEFIKLLKQKKV